MAEGEVIKWITELGSLGLLAVILFKGGPVILDRMTKISADMKDSIDALTKAHATEMREARDRHDSQMREFREWATTENARTAEATRYVAAAMEKLGERVQGCPHNQYEPNRIGVPGRLPQSNPSERR